MVLCISDIPTLIFDTNNLGNTSYPWIPLSSMYSMLHIRHLACTCAQCTMVQSTAQTPPFSLHCLLCIFCTANAIVGFQNNTTVAATCCKPLCMHVPKRNPLVCCQCCNNLLPSTAFRVQGIFFPSKCPAIHCNKQCCSICSCMCTAGSRTSIQYCILWAMLVCYNSPMILYSSGVHSRTTFDIWQSPTCTSTLFKIWPAKREKKWKSLT